LVASLAAIFALALPAFASAAKVPLNVEKSGFGLGTVTSSPSGINCGTTCSAEYLEGTKVTLTATAKAGSVFAGWFGCDAEPAGKCEVTVNEEMTVEAEFNEIETFFLTLEKGGTGTGTVTSSPAGISCGTACPKAEHEYLEGTTVVLTASVGAGSVFEGWFGCDAEPSATKCEVTILGETIVEAEFNEIPKFPLVLEKISTGQGTVTSSPAGINCGATCSAEYLEGTKVTLTASASAGSTFAGWTGCDAEPSATKCEVTILGETIVQAEFAEIEKVPLTLEKFGTGLGTVTSSPSGISCGPSCLKETAEYPEGTTVTLTASANAGSYFEGWTGCDSEPSPTQCKISLLKSSIVEAKFNTIEIKKFKLKVAKAGTGSGTVESTSPISPKIVCGSECEKAFDEGTKVTLFRSVASGSEFVGWSGACSGTSSTCTVTITSDMTVTATFNTKPALTPAPTPAPEPEGKASAAGLALVSGRNAALRLTCNGGPCAGVLKLTAKLKQGTRTKNVAIGRAAFSLVSGASRTLAVKLSAAAGKELDKRGSLLKAKLTGTGVTGSTVRLKLRR
jgi:uncharacterized repeat protein (TIGR02543 family)